MTSLGGLFTRYNWTEWAVLLVLLALGVTAGRVISALLRRAAVASARRGQALRRHLAESASGPVNLALITVGLALGLSQLTLSQHLRAIVNSGLTLLVYVVGFWFAFNLVSLVEYGLKSIAARADARLHSLLAPLIRKTLRIFVVIVGALIILNNVFGQNVGTWLAGLGIAGLAVSLAAQDSLRNLFGSITILLDRPFRPGDLISFSGFLGGVEEVGFRSVKVRTLDGHLVTVPNSKLVNEVVENIGARPNIRRVMTVTITYDTPPEKVRMALEIVKGLFQEDGLREPIHVDMGTDQYPPRAYFSDYGDWALKLTVIYWYAPASNYWDYMEHAERFNLRLLEEFNRVGIDFAFPSQTLFLASDSKRGLDISDHSSGNGR
ncbi:MAG TPA: mechanosensitive ion channel family protein, partial [Spirochaetia bacterium]|nr:mechanosensitive ion channel family protein [Spirochaetia bacterium]